MLFGASAEVVNADDFMAEVEQLFTRWEPIKPAPPGMGLRFVMIYEPFIFFELPCKEIPSVDLHCL